jgi:putative phage-type endonuclease
MTTDIIPFTTEDAWLAARKLDVTSTESAALFGMSPYTTHFELWHAKRSGLAREFKTNERMQWGNRLEAAIAHGIAEEQGWEIKPLKEYMRDPDARLGSSFDFVITSLGEPVHLEIKNVDYLAFRDGWIEHDDGSIEAPEHIEMQVQHQMAVSGFKRAYIGAFIAGNRGVVIERERDEDVIRAIRAKVAAFWRTVDAGDEPAAIMPGDAEAVIRLNQYAQPGKMVDASGDANIALLVTNYKRAAQDEKDAAEDKEVAKALLFEAIGDAEKVLLDGWTISASLQAETPATVITADMIGKTYGGRKGFRNLRINARKPK